MRVKAKLLLFIAAWIGIPAVSGQVSKPGVANTSGSYVGVMLQEIDGDRARALKLPEEAGVEITRIEPDSPADKAGLKTGDVIARYNGQRVEGMEQFSRLVHETPPGREVKLDIFSGGAPQTVTVKTGARPIPRFFTQAPGMALPIPPDQRLDLRLPDVPRSFMSWRSAALGVEVESLDGQLAQYFGVKEGVLVRSVLPGSAAEKAGIKAGDVITRVGDSAVATPADISSRVRALRGSAVPIVLVRDRKEMTLIVMLDSDDR